MYIISLVGVGVFIGTILKHISGGWIQGGIFNFPAGTRSVNNTGIFFLIIIMYFSKYQGLFSEQTRISLPIGVMGTIITLLTFGCELFQLLEDSKLTLLTINSVLTVLLSILTIYLGKILSLNFSAHLVETTKKKQTG